MEKKLTKENEEQVLKILEERFLANMNRHPKQDWETIKEKLQSQPSKIWSLHEMERTGGEPDVIGDATLFMDCSAESPAGRRSVCYDRPALESRKKNQPKTDAETLANEIGIDLLTEEDYRFLQTFGAFDQKTSSWIKTPDAIRKLGGALFCDRRYQQVFTYHNGAESYYAARGFRGKLTI